MSWSKLSASLRDETEGKRQRASGSKVGGWIPFPLNTHSTPTQLPLNSHSTPTQLPLNSHSTLELTLIPQTRTELAPTHPSDSNSFSLCTQASPGLSLVAPSSPP